MKHYITMLAALLLSVHVLFAVPAKPGKINYVQPDGSIIRIELHGDEFFHWVTDEDGNTIVMDANGYYRKAFAPTAAQLAERQAVRQQAQEERILRASASGNTGERTFLVILIEFSDIEFKTSDVQQTFWNLLNQEGYSANNATGSVRDYYIDNSMGKFTPSFDVYGPVPLDNASSYYGADNGSAGNDIRPGQALVDACKKLDGTVDFSKYAVNGEIPAILFYYAGYNQAEGAASTTIWPHEWTLSAQSISAKNRTFDDVVINTYSCTSELQGTSGTTLCGIGTACHEFGHALGLPDFYDTDSSTNGSAGGLYCYSTMCSGNYNNDSHTPPYFNALERTILGWLDDVEVMPASGSITIPSIANNTAYRTASDVADEYFIYECRPGTGWDAPLQGGMIVYHVDKSSAHSILSGNYTAKSVWGGSNKINADGTHPCFYIVPAAEQTSFNYSNASYDYQTKVGYLPFPGKSRTYTYTPVSWSGASMDYHFTSIAFNTASDPSGATVTMAISSSSRELTGVVTDKSKTAIAGATIRLYAAASSQPASSRMMVRQLASGAILAEATTDESGSFTIDLADVSATSLDVAVSAEGFLSHEETITVGPGINDYSVILYAENPVEEEMLYKFNSQNQAYITGSGTSIMGAVLYSAAELKDDVGRRIDGLTFVYQSEVVDGVYAFVDFGEERQCWVPVQNPRSGYFMHVDLRGYNIKVPADTDCYFGFAVKNPSSGYPLIFEKEEVKEGGMFWAEFNENGATWSSYEGNIFVAASLSPSVPFNYIKDAKNGKYSVGDVFSLGMETASNYRAPSSISWFYDDEPVSGETITLTETGVHTISAEITTQDGTRKVVELEIDVQ